MFKDIIIFFILLLLLLVVFHYIQHNREGFDIPVPVKQYATKLNELTNDLSSSLNMTGNNIIDKPANVDAILQALSQTVPTGSSQPKKAYDITMEDSYEIPSGIPSTLQHAQSCEAAPKSCDAFNDPTFSQYCGMSFDIDGMAADGSSHTGGLYVSTDDKRRYQKKIQKVIDKRIPPYDQYKVPQPTIGKASEGKFALTKDKCLIVKEKVDCAAKQTFGSPNCTQCYTTRDFSRVGPEIPRIPFNIFLIGNGTISIDSPGNIISLVSQTLTPTTPINIEIPSDSEGKTFIIRVFATGQGTYVSGYIIGNTARGPIKIDLNVIVEKDLMTNLKSRMSGTKMVNGFRCLSMIPGKGKDRLALSCIIPFSFIDLYDSDLLGCENGPVITKASSATFLESSPCFGKVNQPGNYKLECLQERWIGLGGTSDGTGYPSTQAKADDLQKPYGRSRDIDTIVDFLADKMTQAVTGTDEYGAPLSISDWNTLSMWGLGIPINSPCDIENRNTGPLTKRCMSHLYINGGKGTKDGATYTGLSDYASKKLYISEGFDDIKDALYASGAEPRIYNEIGGSLDPGTTVGYEAGKMQGGVDSYKTWNNSTNTIANANSLTNKSRALQIDAVYKIKLKPNNSNKVSSKPEVFAVGPSYIYKKQDAPAVCAVYGAQPATTAQLKEAYNNGADWCFTAYTAEGTGLYPITTSVQPGCSSGQGITSYDPEDGRAGILCYGAKPAINSITPGKILPFNKDSWQQPTNPGYSTVENGYLETSGSQPGCFNNVPIDEAQKTCDSMGAGCVGFSYSIDGQGHGCYKGNFHKGKHTNGNYMGFVKNSKVSTEQKISGRYINLEYSPEYGAQCLNLAQIMVYSSEGGGNIIKPNTIVNKSSGYQGDMFPSSNFVDGYGKTFVHTSCSDVPWIQIDLGTSVPIYKVVVLNRKDCCQSRVHGAVLKILSDSGVPVYTSNPVQTTNSTYTWNPPDMSVKLDVPGDVIPPPPTQWAYGDNGTVSCDTYCRGTGRGPWNGELPRSWNGAQCIDTDPRIGGCHKLFTNNSGAPCLCQANGEGWR